MRLSKICIVLLVSGSTLFAQNFKKELKSNMNEGINKIQKGLIDNDKTLIKEGVIVIRKGNQLFWDKQNLKKHLPDNKSFLLNKALLISYNLDKSLLELETNLDNKTNHESQLGYVKILNNCSKCHKLLNKSL